MPSRISQMLNGTAVTTTAQPTQLQPPMQPRPLRDDPYIQQLRNTMNFIQNSRNPQMMLSNMMMQNPQFGQAVNLLKSFNGNAQQAIASLAKMRGVDPNEVFNALQGK